MAAAAVATETPVVIHLSDEYKELRGTGSILEKLELQATGKDELYKKLTVREEDRSTIRHNEWAELSGIPVIDLSLMQTDRPEIVKQIHEAVTQWGFFQVVNHGIPLEVLRETRAIGVNFFALPSEVKLRATPEPGYLVGYTGDNTKTPQSTLHWAENLYFNSKFLDRLVRQVWPNGSEEIRDTLKTYSTGAENVAKQLHALIAECFGLPQDLFAQHYGTKINTFRFNFYPACPRPTESIGASAHTDPSCLTVLLQDNVGGLQVEKNGQWIGVKPIEGSLVINIGDMLHAWTNGMCKSVLHRAVVNQEIHRLSLAAFLNVDANLAIYAPEELIDEDHPRLYKSFTVKEYTKQYPSRVREKRTNGVRVLETNFKFEK